MLYLLSYTWHEDYRPYLVEGPEVPNWSEYCNSILQEAIDLAVVEAQSENISWIGWSILTEYAIKVLAKKGYKLLQPVEHSWFGSCIIRKREDCDTKNNLKDYKGKIDFSKIYKHNRKIQADLDKSLYKNRFTKQEENLIKGFAYQHFHFGQVDEIDKIFCNEICIKRWRISKENHITKIRLYSKNNVIKEFTSSNNKQLKNNLEMAWKDIEKDPLANCDDDK